MTAYDPNCPGRPAAVTDPLGGITRTTWDASCTFALSVANPVGHLARTQYFGVIDALPPVAGRLTGPYGDYVLAGRYGQTARSIDVNGAATLTTYDEWGRQAATWSPLDRADRAGTTIEYQDACPAQAINDSRCDPPRTTNRGGGER